MTVNNTFLISYLAFFNRTLREKILTVKIACVQSLSIINKNKKYKKTRLCRSPESDEFEKIKQSDLCFARKLTFLYIIVILHLEETRIKNYKLLMRVLVSFLDYSVQAQRKLLKFPLLRHIINA